MTTALYRPSGANPPAPDVWLPEHLPLSRFHVVTLAIERAKQLHQGARPRVDAPRHRAWRLALLEVEADQVAWYLP